MIHGQRSNILRLPYDYSADSFAKRLLSLAIFFSFYGKVLGADATRMSHICPLFGAIYFPTAPFSFKHYSLATKLFHSSTAFVAASCGDNCPSNTSVSAFSAIE